MAEKGQITIEALLIFGMFTLLFIGITFPSMLDVYTHTNDATRVMEMRENLDTIATAIQLVRNGGPGTVKTVTITSNSKTWLLYNFNDSMSDPFNSSLYYFVYHNSTDLVPPELDRINQWGGIGIHNFDGIKIAPDFSYYFNGLGGGQGTWKFRIENRMTNINDTNPYIWINNVPIDTNTVQVIIQ